MSSIRYFTFLHICGVQEFHKDKIRYFNMQYDTSKAYIVPFIGAQNFQIENANVLEIGSGEGGVLKAFTELGFNCVGIELSSSRVNLANEFMKEERMKGQVQFISSNIYNINPELYFKEKFDIIILKDVIEHIFDHEKFLSHLKSFLKEDGIVFFGFPPWQMPFGGHQQILKNKFISHFPYIHLLPAAIYKFLLTIAKERPVQIDELMDLRKTGLSIERFEKLVKTAGYSIVNSRHYLTNPIYSFKFGIKTREQYKIIQSIKWMRNFVTTGVYYTIKIND